jgi:dTDP-4-dehydrorhamnose reductase
VAGLGSLAHVEAIATTDYPTPATRPAYSVLSTGRYTQLTGAEPESWREGLRDYLHTSDTPHSLPRP